MKNIYYYCMALGLIFSMQSQAQETEQELLLAIEDNWRSERLSFPISFAPSLDYKGYEEVRFAKGWSKKDSDEFWTYAFVWYLDEDPELDANQLNLDIAAYFDGLMSRISQGKSKDFPSKVDMSWSEEEGEYKGVANIYDAFFTKGTIPLKVTIEEEDCPLLEKHTVLFRFTLKDWGDPIWDTLNAIQLNFECQ